MNTPNPPASPRQFHPVEPAEAAIDPAALGSHPLIGLDWGTSNLRAFLIATDGRVLRQRQRPWGILRLPDPGTVAVADRDATPFDAALADIAGDWIRSWPEARLLACGMVGSRQGWREAPYLAVPADPADIARARVEFDVMPGRSLSILPGLCQGRDDAPMPMPATGTGSASDHAAERAPDRPFGSPDVMRGEETQAVGALARDPAIAEDSWLILPGTHSKWVRVRQGRLLGFATHMTGELFDVLCRHSILAQSLVGSGGASGRARPGDRADEARAQDARTDEARGFDHGVRLAADDEASLQNLLFGVRARTLLRDWSATAARGMVSGILIGHEVRMATAGLHRAPAPLVLVGEPALCDRYVRALDVLGLAAKAVMDNTAADGLYRIGTSLREQR